MSTDTTLTCRDCSQAFTFTSGEQEFYASRGFSEPSRCADCRAAREMFTATCSSCGQPAQVPFQPSGEKPVYCSACFEQRRAGGGDRGGRYRGRGR
jgi:CxxC-x17-CxxC domain-containing protein